MIWILAISAIVNGVILVRTIFIILATPRISKKPSASTHLPLVSILLPARNEASRILAENIESLVTQNYQNLEIIAVDDRSTDNTLQILRSFEHTYPKKLWVIEGLETPPGWLGKLFALQQAKFVSKGEWLIMMDADVVYSEEIVSNALAFALKNNLDALTLLPQMVMPSFWEGVVMPCMSWLFVMRVSPTQANRRSSRASLGLGHFILFKRTVHDQIGGYDAYKGAILDDCVTMEMLKGAGYEIKVAYSPELMRSRFYSNLSEIIQGFGKNAYASLGFSRTLVIGFILYEFLAIFFPHLYILGWLLKGGESISEGLIVALLSVGLFFLTVIVFGLVMRADLRGFFGYLIGHAIAVWIMIYSTVSFEMGRGVSWKGRSLGDLSPNKKKGS